MNLKVCAALSAIALLISGPAAVAQSGPADAAFAATTVSLTAEGVEKASPDMADLDTSVATTSQTAAAALADNAERMTKVITALKRSGIEDRDLRTQRIGLSPQYVYEQGKPPRLSGYQASNQLTVTVRDLSRLGSVVDAVVAAGASTVGQISFGLSDAMGPTDRARLAAVKALQARVALYAEALGYRVGRLVRLSEGGGGGAPAPIRPMMLMAARAQDAAPTPVEAGESEVRVEITGLFELTR